MEGGSSQIGMDDHSGRIDDPTELRLNLKFYLSLKEGIEAIEGKERYPLSQRVLLYGGSPIGVSPVPFGWPRPPRFGDRSLRDRRFPDLKGFHPHSVSYGESVDEGMETLGFLLVRSVLIILKKFIRMNRVGHSNSFFSQTVDML